MNVFPVFFPVHSPVGIRDINDSPITPQLGPLHEKVRMMAEFSGFLASGWVRGWLDLACM
jgi:hypothetical protein